MGIYGFIGPSIQTAHATELLEANYRAPALKGSLHQATEEGAKIILLIDGQFETVPSVWHKEILWCLDAGVAVLGSSSMGALRATETAEYGMLGVGKIYEYFCRGANPDVLKYLTNENQDKIKNCLLPELRSKNELINWLCFALVGRAFIHEDDVAVLHGPAELGHLPLTNAMVDIFFTLESAPFSEQTKTCLLLLAKSLHFKERTYNNLRKLAKNYAFIETQAEIFDWLDAFAFSQKKNDAVDLLKNLNQHLLKINIDLIPKFSSTRYWKHSFQ